MEITYTPTSDTTNTVYHPPPKGTYILKFAVLYGGFGEQASCILVLAKLHLCQPGSTHQPSGHLLLRSSTNFARLNGNNCIMKAIVCKLYECGHSMESQVSHHTPSSLKVSTVWILPTTEPIHTIILDL